MVILFLALLVIVRRGDQLITARNDELATAYTQLQAAEAMRDDLTDMIVHDLRSPLTAVEISIQLLNKPSFNNEANRNRLFTNAQSSLHRAIRLINDMLDVAKLEEGRLELTPTLVDMKQLLQERASFYAIQSESERKQIELLLPDQPLTLRADPEIITRVLDNLVSNAFKYVRRDGRVQLIACLQNNHLQVGVADDGEGISPENAQRIFDKFVQVKDESSNTRRGTGLGLTFCRLAVEAHGGRIWVESELGQGSTFYFTLPL
jgi:signal transduction histidine kinase